MEKNGIGGYFELEHPRKPAAATEWPTYYYQSARAAFASFLLQTGASRVWLPYFLCDSIAEELKRVGLEVARFELESDLSASADLSPGPSEVALVPNYFGVCATQVNRSLDRLPRDRCVVDNSQAFGEPPGDCLATIYSCRKFFGVPDGGLLVTTRQVREPLMLDEGSVSRAEHLLLRLDQGPEAGLSAFRRAEASLAGCEHRSMSKLTHRLMQSIDIEQSFARRGANFRAMHDLFKIINKFPFSEDFPKSPLCYPLMASDQRASELRTGLIRNRVFSPVYWPELLAEGRGGDAAVYARSIVHIPIDQRYEPEQLVQALCDIEIVRQMIDRNADDY